MKRVRKLFFIVLSLVLVLSLAPLAAQAAKSYVKLNKKSVTLTITKNADGTTYGTAKLKVKKSGVKVKSVKYKSSNKKVAAVSKKGKITAKKAGNATIRATVKYKSANKKVKTKKLKCKVSVTEVIDEDKTVISKVDMDKILAAYQEEVGDYKCCLLYINDDEIPECAYNMYSNIIVLAYVDGEVVSQYGPSAYSEFVYKEKSGGFSLSGHWDMMPGEAMRVHMYTFDGKNFMKKYDCYKVNKAYKAPYSYEINDIAVSESEYNAHMSVLESYTGIKCEYATVVEAYKALK